MSKRKLFFQKDQGREEDNSSSTEEASVSSSTSTISPPTLKRKKSLKRLGSVSKLVRKPFRKKKKDEYIKKYEEIDSDNDNDDRAIENDKSFTRIVEKDLNEDDGKVNHEIIRDDNDNADGLSNDDTRPLNDEENNLPPLLVEEAATPSDDELMEDSGSLNDKREKVRSSSMDDCTVPQDAVVGNENTEINISDGEKLKDKETICNSDDNFPLTARSILAGVVEEKDGDNPSASRSSTDTKTSPCPAKINCENKSPRAPDMPVKEDMANDKRAVVSPLEPVDEKKNESTNDNVDRTEEEILLVLEEVVKNSFDTDLSDEGYQPQQLLPEQATTATVIASGGGVGISVISYIVAVVLFASLLVTLTFVYVSSTTFHINRAQSDIEHSRPVQYNSNTDSTVIRNIVMSRKMRAPISTPVHMSDMDGTDRIDVSGIPSPNDADTFAAIAKGKKSDRKISVNVRSMPKDEMNVESKVATILRIKSHNSTMLPPLNDGDATIPRKLEISPESYGTVAAIKENGTLDTLAYIPFNNRLRDAFMRWDSRKPQILIMLATL